MTKKNIKKGLKQVKKGKVTKVTNVDKFFTELDKKRKAHPIYYFFHDLYYRVKRFIDDIPLNIRSFIQRGKRGYSDRDTWNFHYFLSDIIYKGVEDLKKQGYTLPTWKEGKSDLQAENEWDCILNAIIHTFRTAKEISNGDLLYTSSKEFDYKKYEEMKRGYEKDKDFPKGFRPMNLEEAEEFEKGFRLFAEWFFALDD